MRFMSLLFIVLMPYLVIAQLPPQPLEQGAIGLGLLLRKLDNYYTVLYVTAHPDDEDNGLLVEQCRVQGIRAALLTLTRGAGGQNQIGDEQDIALSVLRTEELASMHRLDGAEQYFGRAVDFGYSFSVDETFEKWGREEILRDIVYHIRRLRPDIILCMSPRGGGGGQHHQASGVFSQEAFRLAADPNAFPDQIEKGLQPWQAKKLLSRAFRMSRSQIDPERLVEAPIGIFDPLLNHTAEQFGRIARSFHICQDMNRVSPLPGRAYSRYYLEDTTLPKTVLNENLFSGISASLFDYLSGDEQKVFPSFQTDLAQYRDLVAAARKTFSIDQPWNTIVPLHQCMPHLLSMIESVQSSNLSAKTKQDVLVRLAFQAQTLQQALILAHGIVFDAEANQGEVTPGGRLKVSLHAYNASPLALNEIQLSLHTPDGWQAEVNMKTPSQMEAYQETETVYDVTVPQNASHRSVYWQYHPTASRYEWIDDTSGGLPFSQPPLQAELSIVYAGNKVSVTKPVVFRYENPWGVGSKEKEVSVLPNLSLTITPNILVFSTENGNQSKTVSVQVQCHQDRPIEAEISLQTPDGWSVEPSSIPVKLNPSEKNTAVSFQVTAGNTAGTYQLAALAKSNGKIFNENVQTIDYQHIQKRYYITPSTVQALVMPIQTVSSHIGYIMGSGDQVPQALEQLGCRVTLLDEQAVTNGNLQEYDTIILGVRAYLNRSDLRKHNARLLEYVHQGGTVIAQYNKDEFNDAQWGPYPAQNTGSRITDENAPIQILQPQHPLFHFPNTVTDQDWQGWVQERGIYFLGRRSSEYVDLLASEDPLPNNAGEKTGILVEARYGKGKWLYCALGLFRQLPAGVPGAYKLLANLAGYSQFDKKDNNQKDINQ